MVKLNNTLTHSNLCMRIKKLALMSSLHTCMILIHKEGIHSLYSYFWELFTLYWITIIVILWFIRIDNWTSANGFRGPTGHLLHLESATNLGIVFNGSLLWFNHISVVVGRIYSVLRKLWTVIDSTPFAFRMQLAKTYLIPVL